MGTNNPKVKMMRLQEHLQADADCSARYPATDPVVPLWQTVITNAIDESLRVKPCPSVEVTMQTIVNARKFIQTDQFYLWYSTLYGEKPDWLIEKLKGMWVELCRNPRRSLEFRRAFNAGNGGEAVRRRVGRESRGMPNPQPDNHYWERPRDKNGRWCYEEKPRS